eukprot:12915972-Prorocentrum_lima.AAC.1
MPARQQRKASRAAEHEQARPQSRAAHLAQVKARLAVQQGIVAEKVAACSHALDALAEAQQVPDLGSRALAACTEAQHEIHVDDEATNA